MLRAHPRVLESVLVCYLLKHALAITTLPLFFTRARVPAANTEAASSLLDGHSNKVDITS